MLCTLLLLVALSHDLFLFHVYLYIYAYSNSVNNTLYNCNDTDAKYDENEDGANNVSRAVSRRDMATQMSPESSNHSSHGRNSSFSLATPSILPIVELHSSHSSKPEMRDVLVDDRVTVTRWSKKNRGKIPRRGSRNSEDWKRKAVNYHSSSWDVSNETSKSVSK